jgi:hypothetical protein
MSGCNVWQRLWCSGCFSKSWQRNTGRVLRICHDHFVPQNFQFLVYNSPGIDAVLFEIQNITARSGKLEVKKANFAL